MGSLGPPQIFNAIQYFLWLGFMYTVSTPMSPSVSASPRALSFDFTGLEKLSDNLMTGECV